MKKLLLAVLLPVTTHAYMTCEPSRLDLLATSNLAQHTYLSVNCDIEQRWNEPREYRIVIQNYILGKYAGDMPVYASAKKTYVFTLQPGDHVKMNLGEWLYFILPAKGYDRYVSQVNITTQSGDTLKATYNGRVDVL